jgi:hypothetical protein
VISALNSFKDLKKILYQYAEEIARQYEDDSGKYLKYLPLLHELPNKSLVALCDAFADTEVYITGEYVRAVAGFIFSEDKGVAQSVAILLVICGGASGKGFVHNCLRSPSPPIHEVN